MCKWDNFQVGISITSDDNLFHSDNRYFRKMTIIFSSQPFYGQYVRGSTPNGPVSPKIYDNSKLWPFSKDALEPLMVAIYPSLHLLPSKVSIGIKKAFFHRTVFSYVTLTCFSHIFLQAGKVLQQILRSGLMHWQKGFQHLKDFIILQMQDFLIARNFLSLFMVFAIIFRSGVLQVFGMCFI